ncbi:MAG: ribose 5-phosphate isomerase B [Ruthenibacterium sp.]
MIKTVALGADHGGYELKNAVKEHLQSRGIAVIDCGTNSAESVDYPDMAVPPCKLVLAKKVDVALLFCGTGVGISISANKIKGIRACCCSDVFSAAYTRLHNDANALCMGGRVVGAGLACMIADAFIDNEFEGGRHALRVAKITALEKESF